MPFVRRRRSFAAADPLETLLGDLRGGDRVIRFIEGALRHVKGEWAGKPFKLCGFQKELIHGIYDPVKEDGFRRVRNALGFFPRKQGKTTVAAGLAVYELFCGGMGARVVCAANSRDQASELFTAAADATAGSPILEGRHVISRARKTIADKATGSTFKVISADARTAHGGDLTCWIYDELHGAPDRELYDVLSTSTGARREALGLVISTAGFDKENSILGEVYQHAKRWQADHSIDPGFYAYISEGDPDRAWDDEEHWKLANPAWGEFRQADEMRDLANKARQVPGLVDAFRRLYLNIWTESESGWLDMDVWDKCNAGMPDVELEGAACYGGLDLSDTSDLTAFVLLFQVGDRVYVKHWVWIPADGIHDKELRDRVPYREWAKDGLVELIPGPSIDEGFVAAKIAELRGRFKIERIHFDRWGSKSLVKTLDDLGLTMVDMGQGFGSMSAPTKFLQDLILRKRLAHGGCKLLRWQASCAAIDTDPAGNIKIVKTDKKRHRRRIDSMVAMAMATDALMRCEPTSVYNERGVIFL